MPLPQSSAHRRLSALEKPERNRQRSRGDQAGIAQKPASATPPFSTREEVFSSFRQPSSGRDWQRGHRFARQATTSVGFDDSTECGELRILRKNHRLRQMDLADIATWDSFYDVQWEFILNYLPGPSVLSHKFV